MIRPLAHNLYRVLPMKHRLFELVRQRIRLPARVYKHLHFRGAIDIDISPQASFRVFHHGNQVENDLFWAGYGNGWEGTSLKLWLRLAARAATILDIGANTGVYALSAKTANPKAHVYAFEPVERVHTRLQKNIALNGFDIVAVNAGVSERTGAATMFDMPSEHVYSASFNHDMLADRADLIETSVAVVRMDDFFAARELRAPLLVKIDTERHEVEVLKGFGDIVSELLPTLLIEILDRDIGRHVEAILAGNNYVFFEIIEGEAVRRVGELGGGGPNYLICSGSEVKDMGLRQSLPHEAL